MSSEFRYYLTCPECDHEHPESHFIRRTEQVCPICEKAKIPPNERGGGFDSYFVRIALQDMKGNRFEISACDACLDSGKAIAHLRALADEERKKRPWERT